jgi:predicted esterase
VVLATHGNYDRPEWQCEVWRGIVGDRAFVLCPRGLSRPDSPSDDDTRFTYKSNQELEKEIEAGLAALRARFGPWIDPGPMIYTGFSLGAIMGVAIASRRNGPERYPRMILVEGGFDRWTAANVKAFVAPGGARRILFACGQAGCAQAAKRAAAQLEKAGVATRVVHGKGVGHSYDGPVAEEVKGALGWLLEGDPRFDAAVPTRSP